MVGIVHQYAQGDSTALAAVSVRGVAPSARLPPPPPQFTIREIFVHKATTSQCLIVFNFTFLSLVLYEILGWSQFTLGGTAPPGCPLAEIFLYAKRVLWHI